MQKRLIDHCKILILCLLYYQPPTKAGIEKNNSNGCSKNCYKCIFMSEDTSPVETRTAISVKNQSQDALKEAEPDRDGSPARTPDTLEPNDQDMPPLPYVCPTTLSCSNYDNF
ncbi:MAG: hypothetical protein N0E45_21850 [Candidatus Thiodiazotropha endolucinida]|nr:hypothetical protein [Candidatus Thiodiazotropha taylori]MCW4302276.1 hypothetical protein [Candidatus Thiodiazotropha endolucinida]